MAAAYLQRQKYSNGFYYRAHIVIKAIFWMVEKMREAFIKFSPVITFALKKPVVFSFEYFLCRWSKPRRWQPCTGGFRHHLPSGASLPLEDLRLMVAIIYGNTCAGRASEENILNHDLKKYSEVLQQKTQINSAMFLLDRHYLQYKLIRFPYPPWFVSSP